MCIRDRVKQDQQAKLTAHEEQTRLAAKDADKVDELKWRADILRSSYDKTVEQLADERLKLSHMEANTRELSEKATALQKEAELIASAAGENLVSTTNSKSKYGELQSAISTAKEAINAKSEELSNLETKYVLIPYSGPNGTTRRPIYIECLPNRVVMQPENVTLTGADFVEPLDIENPLAQALRAKREFLQDLSLIHI